MISPVDDRRRKLHVALVHESWPPVESFGGIVRYLVCLAHGLRERGHDVTVVTKGATSVNETTDGGIRVVRVRPVLDRSPWPVNALLANLAVSARYASALEQVHRAHPIDVVEFSSWASEGFAHSVRRPRPHVTRIVTMSWQGREVSRAGDPSWYSSLGDRWRDWTEAFPLRRSDLLLAPSSQHARSVADRLRLATVPEATALGTYDDPGRSEEPAQHGEPERDLLFVGKLGPHKGFDTLVRAFALACRGLPGPLRLRIVGSDTSYGPGGSSYRDYVLAGVAPDVRSRIDILGWLDDGALNTLYRQSAVVVAPSRYESFGLPFIEAMQYGKPVIGTTAGGIPDIVSDGVEGILIAPGDAEALARAMVRVFADAPFRCRLGLAARARYEREFTQGAFASRAEEEYLRVIDGRRAVATGGESGRRGRDTLLRWLTGLSRTTTDRTVEHCD